VPSGDLRPGCPEIDEIEAAEIHGDSPGSNSERWGEA
jgi:hypothetical protein